jgi:hypothetical protein
MRKLRGTAALLGRVKSRNRRILAGVLGLALALIIVHSNTSASKNGQAVGDGSTRAQLIGGWRLVSRESRLPSGEILADPGLSSTPMGVLIYDQSGHVAAQLSRRDRTVEMIGKECEAAATIKGTPDTAQTVLGYDAYFGTYALNEREGIVTHHLEAALWPGDIGKSIERSFTISGDRLKIWFTTTTKDGAKVTRTLMWERLK